MQSVITRSSTPVIKPLITAFCLGLSFMMAQTAGAQAPSSQGSTAPGAAAPQTAVTSQASKPDFIWSMSGSDYVTNEKVTFANGAEIKTFRMDGSPQFGCELAGIAYRSANSKTYNAAGPCDGFAFINAAWPSVINAKVAIVSTNCGGTICHGYNDYFVVLPAGQGVRVLQIGTGHYGPKKKATTISFTFSGNELKSSVITNFYSGAENDLGDLIPSKRTFLKGKGYFQDAFKPEFIDLVGEHPERFLEDDTFRSGLVAKMGPSNFRILRSVLSGPGSSQILNGRFVIMEACQKSNCGFVWGAVVVDGLTGDATAVIMEDSSTKVAQYSTRPLKAEVDSVWVEKLDAGEKRFLTLEKGVIRMSKF